MVMAIRPHPHPHCNTCDTRNGQDCFVGTRDGGVDLFLNTGSSTRPVFSPLHGAANPFHGFDVRLRATPWSP